MSMIETAPKVADYLLQIKAIIMQPANPYQWASGWFSPLYCDNRKILSYPNIRNFIRDALRELINYNFIGVDDSGDVTTGRITHEVLLVKELNLPFTSMRSMPKENGLKNQDEGDIQQSRKEVVDNEMKPFCLRQKPEKITKQPQ